MTTPPQNPDPDPLKISFPDASAIFSFKPRSLDSIRDEAIVVLDTNVLLLPYDTSKASLEVIEEKFSVLIRQQRLFLPARVAREFARLRLGKLGEVIQALQKYRDGFPAPRTSKYPLLESLPEYKTLLPIEKQAADAHNAIRATITGLLDVVRSWYFDDPISDLYRTLFTSDVIFEPDLPPEAASQDITLRKSLKLPPGYKDAGKDDGGAGDIIIWQTILELGRQRRSDLIFVTEEKKADWFHRGANEILFPRSELIDEYRRASDGKSLYILNFSRLLELLGAKEDVVDEVRSREEATATSTRSASKSPRSAPKSLGGRRAERAVWDWLFERNPRAMISTQTEADIVVSEPPAPPIAFEVLYLRQEYVDYARVREAEERLVNAQLSGYVVLVGSDERVLDFLKQVVDNNKPRFGSVGIIVGKIDLRGEFQPVAHWGRTLI